MSKLTSSLDREFVVLDSDKNAHIEVADSALYERIDKSYGGFKNCELISSYEFDCDWPTWEIHPNGDEIVILLRGKATFILQIGAEDKSVILEDEGAYVVVPRNTWHTAKISEKTKLLFITPGEGTEQKDI